MEEIEIAILITIVFIKFLCMTMVIIILKNYHPEETIIYDLCRIAEEAIFDNEQRGSMEKIEKFCDKEFIKVNEDEYLKFLKEYPRNWEQNFFMDWLDTYDFLRADPTAEAFKKLEQSLIARKYLGYDEIKYYIINAEHDED